MSEADFFLFGVPLAFAALGAALGFAVDWGMVRAMTCSARVRAFFAILGPGALLLVLGSMWLRYDPPSDGPGAALAAAIIAGLTIGGALCMMAGSAIVLFIRARIRRR